MNQCPECYSRTKGRFHPKTCLGPLAIWQMGSNAMTVDLVVSQMVPLNRCACCLTLIPCFIGIKLSEATCLRRYIGLGLVIHLIHGNDNSARIYLLRQVASDNFMSMKHGFRVRQQAHWWLHVATDGLVETTRSTCHRFEPIGILERSMA